MEQLMPFDIRFYLCKYVSCILYLYPNWICETSGDVGKSDFSKECQHLLETSSATKCHSLSIFKVTANAPHVNARSPLNSCEKM